MVLENFFSFNTRRSFGFSRFNVDFASELGSAPSIIVSEIEHVNGDESICQEPTNGSS